MRAVIVPLAVLAATTLGWGCGGSSPAASAIAVAPGTNNALSLQVSFEAPGASSARLIYWSDGEEQQTTPYVALKQGAGDLTALGLRPGTLYHLQVEARTPQGRSSLSEPIDGTTGELPDQLKDIHLETIGTPENGYVLVSLLIHDFGALVAFDFTGQIRWYHLFDQGMIGDAKLQPNGNITAFVGQTSGWQPLPGTYYELSPTSDIVHTFAAASPAYTDNHELWLTSGFLGETHLHYFTYTLRTVDLSPWGGPEDAQVAGHQLVRQLRDGPVEFVWDAWDHIDLSDCEEPQTLTASNIDFDHPNAIDFDLDGNYIVSWKKLNEITKIDARTGEVLWRLGGKHNQFTLVNDPLGGFSGQHFARILPNGHLILFDNGTQHASAGTRVVEYALDETAKTATLVWQYQHDPILYTPVVGSVERYGDGQTLIGFGWAGVLDRVGPEGDLRWEGVAKMGTSTLLFYRALKLPSLYQYAPL